MNADGIFTSFARHEVDAMLIGGMNFLLRHRPVLTFDIDFWVRDTADNLARVNEALRELGAEWGRSETTWGPLPAKADWLQAQSVFCLTTKCGAVDIFREVRGLEGQYATCRDRAVPCQTASGISYLALSDPDMLACQLALPEKERRLDRVAFLTEHLKTRP
jgi:hypothetical protein